MLTRDLFAIANLLVAILLLRLQEIKASAYGLMFFFALTDLCKRTCAVISLLNE